MFTNDLKKGDRVQLFNGWIAEILDNKKGNTRLCRVFGTFTECGSVYAHDMQYLVDSKGELDGTIQHTPAQLRLKETMEKFG